MKKRGAERGISPLIATVLIIGFVVALAVILIVWGGGFTKGIISKQEYKIGTALQCGKVGYDVIFDVECTVAADGKATYQKDVTTFENKGSLTFEDFYVRVHTVRAGVITNTAAQYLGGNPGSIFPVKPYEVKKANGLVELIHGTGAIVGGVTKLDLIPIIKLESGEEVSCEEKFLEKKIPTCPTQ